MDLERTLSCKVLMIPIYIYMQSVIMILYNDSTTIDRST